jgi:hypothetical protein
VSAATAEAWARWRAGGALRFHLWLPVMLGICGACGDGNTFEVVYAGQEPFVPALLTVDVQWVGGGTHLEGADFTTKRYGTPHSERIDVPGGGPLRVEAQLVTPSGDTLAHVSGSLRLEPDFTYGAGLDASAEAPQGVCVSISDRAPLRDPESGELTGDTLFLTLGGLPRRAIC